MGTARQIRTSWTQWLLWWLVLLASARSGEASNPGPPRVRANALGGLYEDSAVADAQHRLRLAWVAFSGAVGASTATPVVAAQRAAEVREALHDFGSTVAAFRARSSRTQEEESPRAAAEQPGAVWISFGTASEQLLCSLGAASQQPCFSPLNFCLLDP